MESTKTPADSSLYNKTVIICGLLLLFRCSIGGFVTIFLPIFFAEMGFSSFEIGLINTLSPLAVMCGSPVWGAIADSREGIRKYLMIGLSSFSLACLLSLVMTGLFVPREYRFYCVLTAICLNQFGAGSISSLMDSLVVEILPKNAYGKLRLWCAVGYGASAGIVGLAMLYVKSEIVWLPYVTHFGPAVVCAIVSITLMCFLEGPPKTDESRALILAIQDELSEIEAGKKEPPKLSFAQKIAAVPKTIDMFFFLLVVFICGSCLGLVSTFLFIFIQNSLHGTQVVMGVSVLVTCAFEVPIFYYSGAVFNYIPPDYTLFISLVAYVLRFGMYWILAYFKLNAWFVLIPEILHGFTFALMWASAVAKTSHSISGAGLLNFGVGFMSGVNMLGQATGAFLGGLVIQKGISLLWVWQTATYTMAAITTAWLFVSAYNYISGSNLSVKDDEP